MCGQACAKQAFTRLEPLDQSGREQLAPLLALLQLQQFIQSMQSSGNCLGCWLVQACYIAVWPVGAVGFRDMGISRAQFCAAAMPAPVI